MSERLTKEREAEIRRVVDKMGFHPTPALVRDLLAEIDALRAAPPTTYLHADVTEEPIGELVERLTREAGADRAARVVLGDSLRNEVTARLDAEERAQKAEARVRELEAEVQKAREAMGNGTDDSRWRPGESSVDALIRERDTERAARVATEELLRDVSENRAQIEDLAHELKDRVRELEAGRDMARAEVEMLRGVGCSEDGDGPCGACLKCARQRADKREADLAETRAQLARLREAAEAVDEADASGDDTVLGVAIRNLRAALSTPGHTLAEIERAAQVRALMDAEARWMADHAATPEAVAVAAWLRRCADDLEAGRE